MPTCPHPSCPCGHKSISAEALIDHVRSSPWSTLYFCATCKCVCKSEAVLTHHNKKVHKTAYVSCRTCNRQYPNASALQHHFRDAPVHPTCTRCNIGFADNASMQTHITAVHPHPLASVSSSAFSCQVCNKQFSIASALEQHYRDTPVHPKCRRCNIGFVNNAAMQAHTVAVHPPIPPAAFSCRTCNVLYTSADLLERHYLEAQSHPKCTRCNIGFVDNAAMQAHTVAVHPPIPPAAFSCRACNFSYSSVDILERHYLDAQFHPKCTPCNIGFADNAAMQAHVDSIHHPIACSTCNGLRIYQEDVADHYRTSPQHPSCSVCDIGFENDEALDEVRLGVSTRQLTTQDKLTLLPARWIAA
ncbi:hypothetical protein F5148DRAFT_497503 [Russula earlei]|uniref:Uncharacterized protein n=1 Tax=Russula earlei TaxID=71964 RepID=A0ACC0TXG3_9AGAM|nr:hypothetical protein F5148DRAFT_497503 [Russula earlei]